MKFISWNIDSLNAALTGTSPRASLTRAVIEKIAGLDADMIAVQETKLSPDGPTENHKKALEKYFPDYDFVWVSSRPPAKKGYAGTMTLYKKSIKVSSDFPEIGSPDTMDMEGRIVTLESEKFYFTQVYTPNSGDGLKRLEQRQLWDEKYRDYLKSLDSKKPVIACGDFNCAHKEIDLANPASNHFSAGFTDQEREGFTKLLDAGFTDTFRKLNGDIPSVYSWWAQRVKSSKQNNSGWRIDYFLVSNRIADSVKKSEMIDSGSRQDHAPILLEVDL